MLKRANATINIIYPTSYQIGENTVKVVVTSEDGTNTQEYIITVNRLAPSSIAEIEEIKVINVNTNAVHMLNDIVYGTQ
ncbi:MAG: cadherin-like beta sandwich domain-containing protein, partial [Acholeplasmataceae bacterium]|nr:cadherin-like beta sandwich domain-containing protein [Acholeplasmataceae bacterium]